MTIIGDILGNHQHSNIIKQQENLNKKPAEEIINVLEMHTCQQINYF